MFELEPSKLVAPLKPTTGGATASSPSHAMGLVHVDQKVIEGAEATNTSLLECGDLSAVIASRRDGLAQLSSENHLIL